MKKITETMSSFNNSLDIAAQQTHKVGKRRYIILYGTCIVGTGIFLGAQIVEFYLHSVRLSGLWLVLWLSFSLLVSAGLGSLFGWVQWMRIERRVLRADRK